MNAIQGTKYAGGLWYKIVGALLMNTLRCVHSAVDSAVSPKLMKEEVLSVLTPYVDDM